MTTDRRTLEEGCWTRLKHESRHCTPVVREYGKCGKLCMERCSHTSEARPDLKSVLAYLGTEVGLRFNVFRSRMAWRSKTLKPYRWRKSSSVQFLSIQQTGIKLCQDMSCKLGTSNRYSRPGRRDPLQSFERIVLLENRHYKSGGSMWSLSCCIANLK